MTRKRPNVVRARPAATTAYFCPNALIPIYNSTTRGFKKAKAFRGLARFLISANKTHFASGITLKNFKHFLAFFAW